MIVKDKQYHFIAGLLIALAIGLIFASPLIGAIAAVVGGAAKESFDYFHNKWRMHRLKEPTRDVDVWDFNFTVAGGIAGSFLLSIFLWSFYD